MIHAESPRHFVGALVVNEVKILEMILNLTYISLFYSCNTARNVI